MKLKLLSLLLILLIGAPSMAQSEWEENRQPFAIEEGDEEYPLYYLYRAIGFDFKYIDRKYVCDRTVHVIVRATNEDALESSNRIYIPVAGQNELIDVKSRAISPDGKITKLNQEDIKEIEDEEIEGGYRIFAVEGAEVGGEIEYRYVLRGPGRVFLSDVFQFGAPVREYELSIKSPENLEYDFVVNNDTATVKQIDDTEEYNLYQLKVQNVPPFATEGFAAGRANKKRVDFKLAYNTYAGNKRLNTYSDGGKLIYDGIHEMDKAEERVAQSFIKDNDLKSEDVVARLKKLEHDIKGQFFINEYASDKLTDFFRNKYGDKKAFVKLFVSVLQYLDVKYELVVTSNRSEERFNPDFDSWSYLDEYLIYLPDQKVYLAPYQAFHRYGSVPPELTATKGIFVGARKVQDFAYPVTRIGYIEEAPYQENMNNLNISMTFDEDLANNQLQVTREFTGMEATLYKFVLTRANEEQKTQMLDELVRYLAADAEVGEVKVTKGELGYERWGEPFEVTVDFETDGYLENAGNTILLKVGDLIGEQSELYQEDERQFEVENEYNRGYDRRIRIEIPDGYQVQNADDLVIVENVKEDDKVIYRFESSYELNGNELSITIDEFYDQIYYPVAEFEAFRKVINAAADWNKITLVLKRI